MNRPLTIDLAAPPALPAESYAMGTSRRPDGATLTVTRESLLRNGKPWTPVMGELHYARVPESDWREELLKLKMGGLELVASYVFWIHHEETEGTFDWEGRKSLRRFAETCREVGLNFVVRVGPWCHGEVRNGGLPDWTLALKTRTDDPAYLAKVRVLYREIAGQLGGLLWKDGGPVVGVQIENEFGGPAQHLLTLKRLAREAGLDVPLYTRTGWPELATPMPFGELLPLYGVYAEGFWDRELTPMPGNYWAGFQFSHLRTDSAIATDLLGKRVAKDAPDVARYPYLTCEIGGGMMSSYHRRIAISPEDIEATVLVKLGSGSTLPGYYMYHGGTNPEGRTTLMESQATGYWNDLPVKNYDFGAPLGAAGQVRPSYHRQRRLHLFLQDFGGALAGMPTTMPPTRPKGKDDVATLRWAVRTDGERGFIFINNYQRGKKLPTKENVQLTLNLPGGPLTLPDAPLTIPADARLFWPFHLSLTDDLTLDWATAQPLCTLAEPDGTKTFFFAETPGIPARFCLGGAVVSLKPGRSAGWKRGNVRLVLLSESDSLSVYKAVWRGREQVFLTPASLVVEGDTLRLTAENPKERTLARFEGGRFRSMPLTRERALRPGRVSVTLAKAAGTPRPVRLGKIGRPVAEAPVDADFDEAARFTLTLPATRPAGTLLRLHYKGDVLRVYDGERLLLDDFFHGEPLDLPLDGVASRTLTVAILPLRKDAPILLPETGQSARGASPSVDRVALIVRHRARLA